MEIGEANPQAARKIVARFEKLAEILSSHPEMTERGPLPGTRKIYIKPLVLTARVNRGYLEIAAIRHGRQRDAKEPVDIDDGESVDS